MGWRNRLRRRLFFSQGTAYCTGRGEKIQALNPLPDQKLWIVKPPVGTSTPAVYGKLQAAQLLQRNPEECLQQFLSGTPCYFNDLEEAACSVTPELVAVKENLLRQGYQTVLLSGSGSSFFCIGSKTPHVEHCSHYAVKLSQPFSSELVLKFTREVLDQLEIKGAYFLLPTL